MWARMQKDRNQRSRSGGIFNLGDDSGPREGLTHRGQALGNNDEDGEGAQDDEDDDLNAEVVDQLHFGGDGNADSRATHPQVRSTRSRVACDSRTTHTDVLPLYGDASRCSLLCILGSPASIMAKRRSSQ